MALRDKLSRPDAERLISSLLDGEPAFGASEAELGAALGVSAASAAAIRAELTRLKRSSMCEKALGVALLALVTEKSRQAASRPTLVATGLPKGRAKTRNTYSTIIDLIRNAEREIIVVGYHITSGAADVIRNLRSAMLRGVAVTIIAPELETQANVVLSHWPTAPYPKLYTYVDADHESAGTLHAKLFIVDRRQVLVTSANLTLNGLHTNLELGVLCEGDVAVQAATALNDLIAAGRLRRMHGFGA